MILTFILIYLIINTILMIGLLILILTMGCKIRVIRVILGTLIASPLLLLVFLVEGFK